jgi:organic hydroperoxide reductase OsmC/OhrA
VKTHRYDTCVAWAADGQGTKSYRSYSRNFTITAHGKADIAGSSDPAFHGDAARYDPEELLVASLSSCHMLWYLHLCSVNGITVLDYLDNATGTMEVGDNSGQFVKAELRPKITIARGGDSARALALHEEAHRLCFIARSVNFPVELKAEIAEE